MAGDLATTTRRKLVSVNTTDVGGGAERIAWTLFKAMQGEGWDSWFVVGDKKTEDARVLPFYLSPYIDYRRYSSPWRQCWLRLQKRWDRALGRQDYRFPYSSRLPDITGSRPDIVHLHNLHGGYFDLRAAARVSRQIPTFVTLEDCWWFTGHCAYPIECERWRDGCGRCPMLQVPPEVKQRDGTRYNWRAKKALYEQSRLHVAAPSQWLMDRVNQSIFRPAIRESRVIPHGVDLGVFEPAPSRPLRHKHGIAPDALVAVFAAAGVRSSPFKDCATVVQSMKDLAEMGGPPLCLLVVGEEGPSERFGRLDVRHVGFLRSSRELAEMYQMADVYLHAAKEEAFGIVLAEAMACGLPVVATGVGGIPEVVEHGVEGLIVPRSDARAMARAVERLQSDVSMRSRMGSAAVERARRCFDERLMVSRYRAWYEEALERASGAAPG